MKYFSDEVVKSAIKTNIKNQNVIFVFATQIAAALWADKSLEFSGISAVAMERFIAWDDFKGSSIKSHQPDRTSVPSTMRLVFAQNIIRKNSENPFFKSIIKEKFAKTANRFATWISDILPSLAMWKAHFESKHCIPDDEDKDYFEIYNRYKKFLDDNMLFDPAWETPPFNSDGKKYIIFFPEILMDYSEYQELLESSQDIELIHIPQEYYSCKKHDGNLYSNTRVELKEVINWLWKKHRDENIAWNKIALSVPNPDVYLPYIQRDFELYQIPYVLKNGKALSKTGAGKLFSQILKCYSENFSFKSIKALLLNKELPWNDDEAINLLILFGQDNNCLCSFEYEGEQIDVWQKSFANPVQKEPCDRQKNFYNKLKKSVNLIATSRTFSDVRLNYFLFREQFFNFSKQGFSVQNDKILSRCVSELGSLIDLEQKYKDSGMFEMDSCFSFFCDYLNDKMYVPQNAEQGISILPYKTAATAPFELHVVVDASQNSTSVVYKRLQYLRNDKRALLGFTDEDNVTENFILLYAMHSQNETLFTCSSKTIDDYAFLNSYLTEKDHNPKKEFAKETFILEDTFKNEKESLVNDIKDNFPSEIFAVEKNGFDNFVNLNMFDDKDSVKSFKSFENILSETLYEKTDDEINLVKVSSTALNSFYACPRKFLIERVLNADEQNDVTELIQKYTKGNVNHKILEIFLKSVQQCKGNYKIIINPENQQIPEEHERLLYSAIDKALDDYELSYLTKQILMTEKQNITLNILDTVKNFYTYFDGYEVAEVEGWHNFINKEKGYKINCRFDCLLKKTVDICSEDGVKTGQETKYVIVDFKNTVNGFPSDNAFYSDEVAVPDFQMPLYKFVAENQEVPVKIDACLFYDIKENKKLVMYSQIDEITKTRTDNRELNEMFEKTQSVCLEYLKNYVDSVKKSLFDLSAAGITDDDCSECSLSGLCRRVFTINQKRD